MAIGDGIRHEIDHATGQIHDATRWEEEGYLKRIEDEIIKVEQEYISARNKLRTVRDMLRDTNASRQEVEMVLTAALEKMQQ